MERFAFYGGLFVVTAATSMPRSDADPARPEQVLATDPKREASIRVARPSLPISFDVGAGR